MNSRTFPNTCQPEALYDDSEEAPLRLPWMYFFRISWKTPPPTPHTITRVLWLRSAPWRKQTAWGERCASRQLAVRPECPASWPVIGHHGDGYMQVSHPSCTLGASRKPTKVLSQCPKDHFCPHHFPHRAFDNCNLLYVYKILSQASSYLNLTNCPVRWSEQEFLSPFCK